MAHKLTYSDIGTQGVATTVAAVSNLITDALHRSNDVSDDMRPVIVGVVELVGGFFINVARIADNG